jgi:2-methylcitrate dehydratase PrpD
MESALGLALMQMAGSRQVIFGGDPPAKSIYGAFPAQAGVLSAQLAKVGLDARCDLFGPPAGLYPAIYGNEFDLATISRDLFGSYAFMDTEFKPWPASNQVIPFIDAAFQLVPELGDGDIESITLKSGLLARPWLEPLELKLEPQNAAAAANSAPYCVLAVLAAKRFDFAFVDAPGQSPDISTLAGALRVECSTNVKFPTLSIRLRNGVELTRSIEAPLGHTRNPLSKQQHRAKFAQCCQLGTNLAAKKREGEIAVAFEELESVPSVRDITRLLR